MGNGGHLLDMLSMRYCETSKKNDLSKALVRSQGGNLEVGDINLWVAIKIMKVDVLA